MYDPTLKITGSWLLQLPLAAVSANELKGNGKGRSGWKYRLIRDQFYESIRANCKHIPEATERRRVFFCRHYTGRPYDRDNLAAGMKPVRDCLTLLKLIKNDNDKWLEAHYSQLPADDNFVSIVIEELIWR
jgi:hypothetical protein